MKASIENPWYNKFYLNVCIKIPRKVGNCKINISSELNIPRNHSGETDCKIITKTTINLSLYNWMKISLFLFKGSQPKLANLQMTFICHAYINLTYISLSFQGHKWFDFFFQIFTCYGRLTVTSAKLSEFPLHQSRIWHLHLATHSSIMSNVDTYSGTTSQKVKL